MSAGLLPVGPFLALVREEEERRGSMLAVTAAIEGLSLEHEGVRAVNKTCMYRRLLGWRRGFDWSTGRTPQFVSFAVADRIVTRLVGPEGWHTRPDLAALYEDDAA